MVVSAPTRSQRMPKSLEPSNNNKTTTRLVPFPFYTTLHPSAIACDNCFSQARTKLQNMKTPSIICDNPRCNFQRMKQSHCPLNGSRRVSSASSFATPSRWRLK
eukprot:PhF_6_TR10788/c0_g1_i1/m.17344